MNNKDSLAFIFKSLRKSLWNLENEDQQQYEVSEVVSTGPRSAVIYSYWEFKREEMGIKSRKRDLTEPYKLWESEQNNRKCHKCQMLKNISSSGTFKNKDDSSTFIMDLRNQATQFVMMRTNILEEVQFLDTWVVFKNSVTT